MIENKSVLVIIPARGGSKGLPGKNLRKLVDKPLIAWPIEAALGANSVDKIICSTDDLEIRETAIKYGACAPFIRPKNLASDTSSSIDVVIHAIDYLQSQGENYEYVVLLEPTSPLTTSLDIETALTTLHANKFGRTSIVGISRIEATHPEYDVTLDCDGLISPYLAKDFKSLKRRQEIEDLYFFDGSIYISTTEALRENLSFYHDNTLGYKTPRWKSIEIDELFDFLIVETILRNLDKLHLS